MGAADSIADIERHTVHRHAYVLVVDEVLSAAHGLHRQASALAQPRHALQTDGEFVVEEALREHGDEHVHASAPSLQRVGLATADEIGSQGDLCRQRLLQASHQVVLPSAVLDIQRRGAQVDVAGTAIHEQAGILVQQPVDVAIEGRLVTLGDVVLSFFY